MSGDLISRAAAVEAFRVRRSSHGDAIEERTASLLAQAAAGELGDDEYDVRDDPTRSRMTGKRFEAGVAGHIIRALPSPPLARAMRELCEAVDALRSPSDASWPMRERVVRGKLAAYREALRDAE